MPLSLFNTLSKKKEVFTPIEEGRVKMYTCGPTVYGRPHIGNYSSYLMADLLRRWLEVLGFRVTQVKNITDVGHMTMDTAADAKGEDKVEKEARRIAREKRGEGAKIQMADVLEVSAMYTEQYLQDEKALNILPPAHRPKATETIPEMITLVQTLVKAGHAYETEDGVYFSVESFPAYGKLSGNTLTNLDKLREGDRTIAQETKKNPADFALWKKRVGENANHVLFWDSPWGEGFPGWHIECSAMSTKFLGEEIDIHTGGEDNIFPHHECEIAQSECASGKQFVRFFVHKRHVNFEAQKMSKSLGNVLSLPSIIERGFSPQDLRYFLLSSHYRSHMQFSWKGLEDAKKARLRIADWIGDAGVFEASPQTRREPPAPFEQLMQAKGVGDFVQRFREAMDDDLNTPAALAAVFDCMVFSRKAPQEEQEALKKSLSQFFTLIEHVFACFTKEAASEIPVDIQELLHSREEARKAKDFALSDALRKEIEERGFVVEDRPEGPKVTPK